MRGSRRGQGDAVSLIALMIVLGANWAVDVQVAELQDGAETQVFSLRTEKNGVKWEFVIKCRNIETTLSLTLL